MNKKSRIIAVILAVWSFLNIYVYVSNNQDDAPMKGLKLMFEEGKIVNPSEGFYPFSTPIAYYDLTELLVYVGGAWLLFAIYIFLNKK